MPLTRRLRHSTHWVLMLWAFVLAVGVLSPAFNAEAARSMDSVCMAPESSGALPDADSAAHHASLQCPLCWSAAAAPPAVMHWPAADPLPRVRPLAEVPRALHALVAGFEPARGPPRA
jgi:hypothetical protein